MEKGGNAEAGSQCPPHAQERLTAWLADERPGRWRREGILRLEVSALPMHKRERDRGTDLPHGW